MTTFSWHCNDSELNHFMRIADAEFEQTSRTFYRFETRVVCWYEYAPGHPSGYPWVLVSTEGDGRFQVTEVVPIVEVPIDCP